MVSCLPLKRCQNLPSSFLTSWIINLKTITRGQFWLMVVHTAFRLSFLLFFPLVFSYFVLLGLCGFSGMLLANFGLPWYVLVKLIIEKNDLLIPAFGCMDTQTCPSKMLKMPSLVEICLFYDGSKQINSVWDEPCLYLGRMRMLK